MSNKKSESKIATIKLEAANEMPSLSDDAVIYPPKSYPTTTTPREKRRQLEKAS